MSEEAAIGVTLGRESERLDGRLTSQISAEDRTAIWASVDRILRNGDQSTPHSTMALGYVQSGKTTSMSALAAAASDRGYRIVIALLGTTLLLRDQNRDRLKTALGIDENNYTWISTDELSSRQLTKEVGNWLERGRTVFVPILKHWKHIDSVAMALSHLEQSKKIRTLIIDDEADQASLNTNAAGDLPSRTFAAIVGLMDAVPNHLFVQYTATPYAPLLLPPGDPLMPDDVEFLLPGSGYTGGREFLIDDAEKVIRPIPYGDESSNAQISKLPKSLETAVASFVSGSAILFHEDSESAPISMLVHATHRNAIQDRYHFLLQRMIDKWKSYDDLSLSEVGPILRREADRLYLLGVKPIDDGAFWKGVKLVLNEVVLWLINSTSDLKKVSWNYSPFHILVGGNKLDRGFTVEGLTISYMNRKPSEQIDTLEQRARAFGYRSTLLPFCQVFATNRTIRILRGVVHTEDDLRANLRDWIDQGNTISDWAKEIGLDLPAGTRPTRKNVIAAVRNFNERGDWHSLRKPNLDPGAVGHNENVVADLQLFNAPRTNYGRLSFRTKQLPIYRLTDEIISRWTVDHGSPDWRQDEILEILRRHPRQEEPALVILMARGIDGRDVPREREWVSDTGFVNLFQGRDNETRTQDRYEGDRTVGPGAFGSEGVVLQIHYVTRRGSPDYPLLTLAIHLGDRTIVRSAIGE